MTKELLNEAISTLSQIDDIEKELSGLDKRQFLAYSHHPCDREPHTIIFPVEEDLKKIAKDSLTKNLNNLKKKFKAL